MSNSTKHNKYFSTHRVFNEDSSEIALLNDLNELQIETLHQAKIRNQGLSEINLRTVEQYQENIEQYDDGLTERSANISEINYSSSISNVDSEFFQDPNQLKKMSEIIHLNANLKIEVERLLKDNAALRIATLEGDTSLDHLINNVDYIKDKLMLIADKLEATCLTKYNREKCLVNLISMVRNIPERLHEVVMTYKKASKLRRDSLAMNKLDCGDNETKPSMKINKSLCQPGNLQSIAVLCRIKPHIHNCLNVSNDNKIILPPFRNFQNGVNFKFQKVFLSNTSQDDIFSSVSPVLESCFNGCNVCILAYGQSGSGKTHTMLGAKYEPGLIFRSMSELKRLNDINHMKKRFNLSILEVYNETIYDLLGFNCGAKSKVTIQDNGQSVQIKNVSEAEVSDENDLKQFLDRSQRLRNTAIGKTHFTSRSHFMVMLRIFDSETRGVLMLCDLAGSENCQDLDEKGRNESKYINKSITMLTRVFDALYKRHQIVPYRDSKLTHLLKPSLMGNAKCVFIATVCSDLDNLLDTYRTLNVAKKVEKITFPDKR